MNDEAVAALREACKKADGVTALADRIGEPNPSTVFNWLARNGVPANKARRVSTATGVPLSRLRPDIFGKMQ